MGGLFSILCSEVFFLTMGGDSRQNVMILFWGSFSFFRASFSFVGGLFSIWCSLMDMFFLWICFFNGYIFYGYVFLMVRFF